MDSPLLGTVDTLKPVMGDFLKNLIIETKNSYEKELLNEKNDKQLTNSISPTKGRRSRLRNEAYSMKVKQERHRRHRQYGQGLIFKHIKNI